jgi:hypothetical protein
MGKKYLTIAVTIKAIKKVIRTIIKKAIPLERSLKRELKKSCADILKSFDVNQIKFNIKFTIIINDPDKMVEMIKKKGTYK